MTRLSVGTSTERRFFAALNTVTKYEKSEIFGQGHGETVEELTRAHFGESSVDGKL
jgi:molybdopterin converting factor small subunit